MVQTWVKILPWGRGAGGGLQEVGPQQGSFLSLGSPFSGLLHALLLFSEGFR